MRSRTVLLSALVLAALGPPARAERTLSADVYLDRLHAMWLGELIGVCAGAKPAEGSYCTRSPNPATSIDWGPILSTTTWTGDDDTCFEYMYLPLVRDYGLPTGDQLRAAWESHVPLGSFYVANKQARHLMSYGLTPPETGSLARNVDWWAIDSQITTEALGAAAPGLRQRAADLAGAFGSVTNDGYALHAAQFYAALYAAAPFETSVETVVEKGLAVVPTTSRTYEVIQTVRNWYDTDKADGTLDWRTAREHIYDLYVDKDGSTGRYRDTWVESTVNTAITTLAVLYGGGDFTQTVEIGVLSGFDTDCNAATAGGLVGLMGGTAALPTVAAENYYVVGLQNLVQSTTVPQVAADWQAAAEQEILRCGGTIDRSGPVAVYHLPDDVVAPPPERPDPTGPRGLVGDLLSLGGHVTTSASVERRNPARDRDNLDQIIDGITDVSYNGHLPYLAGASSDPLTPGAWFQLNFDRQVTLTSLVYYEGDLHPSQVNDDPRDPATPPRGGFFLDLTVEVRCGGAFTPVGNLVLSEPLDPYTYFQQIALLFDPAVGDAVRIRGTPGGTWSDVSIVELEAYGSPAAQTGWTGAAGNAWDNPANWFAGLGPGPHFPAVFDAAAPQPVLGRDESINRVEFRTAGWQVACADGNTYRLTLGHGGIQSAGAGTNTVTPAVTLAAASAWTVGDGNTLALRSGLDGGGHTLTKDGPGTLALGGARNLTGLTLSGGTVAVGVDGAPGTLVTQGLTLAGGTTPAATLDLARGSLIVDYADGGTSPVAALAAYVRAGLSTGPAGYWDGPGITSSAARDDPSELTAVGIADNQDLGLATFAGQTVDATCVLARYTWWGDSDLSGAVDWENDFLAFQNGVLFGIQNGDPWCYGDYNYDGAVDWDNDFLMFQNGILFQTGPLAGGALSEPDLLTATGGVPEPPTLLLLGAGFALAVAAGRHRHRRRAEPRP